jgi:hypothetical protein
MAKSIRVEDVKKLAELLTSRDDDGEATAAQAAPMFADPTKYTRHTKIDDPETLQFVKSLDDLLNDMRKLIRKAEVFDAKITIAKNEMYERLEETYPTILVARRGQCGLRDWQGAWWYVGWDRAEYAEERPAKDGRGQYL